MNKPITRKEALKLCKGKLPKVGYEKLVMINDQGYWLRSYHDEYYMDITDWVLKNNWPTLIYKPNVEGE